MKEEQTNKKHGWLKRVLANRIDRTGYWVPGKNDSTPKEENFESFVCPSCSQRRRTEAASN